MTQLGRDTALRTDTAPKDPRPAMAAAEPGSPVTHESGWVNHHFLLNAMSVLKFRVDAGSSEASDLIDSISGYLSSGLYLRSRASRASWEHFSDWLECYADTIRRVESPNVSLRVLLDCNSDESPRDMTSARNVVEAVIGIVRDLRGAGGHPVEVVLGPDALTITMLRPNDAEIDGLARLGCFIGPAASEGTVALTMRVNRSS